MADFSNYPTVIIYQDGDGFVATTGRETARGRSRGGALDALELVIGRAGKRGRPAVQAAAGLDESRLVEMSAKGMPVSAMAAALGMTVQALMRYVEIRPGLALRVRQARAAVIDTLSNKIYEAAKAGDMATCRWYLEHADGSKRGRGRPPGAGRKSGK